MPADLAPFFPKFLQFYRVLAVKNFTHPVLVPAPLYIVYTKNYRYAPDDIYVKKTMAIVWYVIEIINNTIYSIFIYVHKCNFP